jgi:hypothetical protein
MVSVMAKLSASQIVYVAITWAEESMLQMIGGCDKDDPYRAEVLDELKQIRTYRDKRFGKPADPFKDARLVNVIEELTPARRT